MSYNLINDHVTEDKYNIKCPKTMTPKGITIHNTSNSAPARNEVAYMKRNDNKVSFHEAIDDIEVVQGIPLNRNAYHAGDGANGNGNSNYIGLEICYSTDYNTDRFAKAELNAIKRCVELCRQYGWTEENIFPHAFFSNKACPHRTDFEWFKAQVKAQLEGKTESPTVEEANKQSNYEIARRVMGTKERCKDVQTKLIYLGYNLGSYGNNGIFGEMTYNATIAFQKDHSDLVNDGWFGVKSYNKLNEVYTKKVQESNKVPQASNSKLSIGNPNKYVEWVARLQQELNVQGFRDMNGARLSADGYSGAKTLYAAQRTPLTYGCKGNITRLVQEALKTLGFFTGNVDGIFGDYTKEAVRKYNKVLGYGSNDHRFGNGCWSKILGL